MIKDISTKGFTLIELMVVMSIVALLMTMVGPLAINTVEKANAKQEMLTMKNWLRKISYRAFATGKSYQLKLAGKKAELFITASNIEQPTTAVISHSFETLFFQPQILTYSNKGFVSPTFIEGTYRGKTLQLDLNDWVNGKEPLNHDLTYEK
ncbi:MAG: type II secretion system GspH family protein [Colwellia sp.]|nr:type II secretion system GspH family protein [Colwellia sp.]